MIISIVINALGEVVFCDEDFKVCEDWMSTPGRDIGLTAISISSTCELLETLQPYYKSKV